MDMLGMYPTFYVPEIGSAWVMGIIGTIHVVASHTSVGAAFLFALLATKAYRESRPELMDYVKRYGKVLLVFSYIIGSVTGVGIWYAITIASPRGTAGLIHNFVWVWAAEWVYFTVEVIGVYALVYLIEKVDRLTHLKLTWAFALASWATMLLIVGILSFMMWPGNDSWYLTGSTNDAFYNINFFAHLGVRTGSMLVMAVIVGLMIAGSMREKSPALRIEAVRTIVPMGILGGALAVLMFFYYLETLPYNAKVMLHSHLLPRYAAGMVLVVTITFIYFLAAWAKPLFLRNWITVPLFLFVAIIGVWPEERTRESMRKPYVAGQYIYGNQTIARDVPGKGILSEIEHISKHGILGIHPFIPETLRTVSEENRREVGELLAKISCGNCHSLEPGSPLRNLPDKFHGSTDVELIAAFINGPLKNGSVPYMPRIDLPEQETYAIATFIASQNLGERNRPSMPVDTTQSGATGEQ
ncbi:cytochrome c [Alcanivorax sp. 24]|uniref:cytochrome c n=1 Tax=Alcanivorax sp. 24 TaxID=2545266 RepID=UPI0010602E75|nr:cytochrome c [Alcanivorax sp. 24]